MLPYDYDSASNESFVHVDVKPSNNLHLKIEKKLEKAPAVPFVPENLKIKHEIKKETDIEEFKIDIEEFKIGHENHGEALSPIPKMKSVKSKPKVTIEKVVKQNPQSQLVFAKSESNNCSVSLLKSTLLKPNVKIPPSISLLKPHQLVSKTSTKSSKSCSVTLISSLSKRSTLPTTVPELPPSISLTPTKPKSKIDATKSLKHQALNLFPSKPAILDTASIADLNNSWAESLLASSSSPSPTKIKKNVSINDWLNSVESKNQNNVRTIGSCTLTPATGKSKTIKAVSSTIPTISLQKISKSTNLTPSVTLTPADPYAKTKRIKFNITPTATITPIKKGQILNFPRSFFPSKPLHSTKTMPTTNNFSKLGKPFKRQHEHVVVTPELHNQPEEDESEEMILEPQIILDDNSPDEMEIDDNEEEHLRKQITLASVSNNQVYMNIHILKKQFSFIERFLA